MWDEEDGFCYDVLRLPDGTATRLKVRSIVGLLPLCAATAVDAGQRERVPALARQMQERVRRMPELLESIRPAPVISAWRIVGYSVLSTRTGCGGS
ncbi:MAG TPA: hypothetical protein VMS01_18165 [Stellaceae bacterium]|nr:hypothetical protein [Stellaceae bacterium]